MSEHDIGYVNEEGWRLLKRKGPVKLWYRDSTGVYSVELYPQVRREKHWISHAIRKTESAALEIFESLASKCQGYKMDDEAELEDLNRSIHMKEQEIERLEHNKSRLSFPDLDNVAEGFQDAIAGRPSKLDKVRKKLADKQEQLRSLNEKREYILKNEMRD